VCPLYGCAFSPGIVAPSVGGFVISRKNGSMVFLSLSCAASAQHLLPSDAHAVGLLVLNRCSSTRSPCSGGGLAFVCCVPSPVGAVHVVLPFEVVV
jgi:hypothetical protein